MSNETAGWHEESPKSQCGEDVKSSEGSEPRKVRGPSVGAHGQEVVTKLSPWSVGDTVTRLLAVAAAREMKVLAVTDHSGEAADVGLHLRDTKESRSN